MTARRARTILLSGAFLFTLIVSGCGYYKISDLSSGRPYFTRRIERNETTLMVQFKDAKTGADISLPAPDVQKITKAEYQAAIKEPY